MPPPRPHRKRQRQEDDVGRVGALHRKADADRRNDQRPGRHRRPQTPAEDRRHERIEDAQCRARQAGHGRQPEQLIVGELEADRRQLGDHHRPHHPDHEGQQQRRNRDPQIAPGDGAALALPERRILRFPFRQHVSGEDADVLLLVDRLHFREFGQLVQPGGKRLAFHALDGEMHPQQRAAGNEEQQHEAAGPDAGEVVERAEGDRQHETAEAADHADQPADRTDIVRVVDRDVLVHRGFAQAHEEAEHEDQAGEGDDAGRHVEVDRALRCSARHIRWADRPG